MFFVIPEMPSKTFVMVLKKLPDHFKSCDLQLKKHISKAILILLLLESIVWFCSGIRSCTATLFDFLSLSYKFMYCNFYGVAARSDRAIQPVGL